MRPPPPPSHLRTCLVALAAKRPSIEPPLTLRRLAVAAATVTAAASPPPVVAAPLAVARRLAMCRQAAPVHRPAQLLVAPCPSHCTSLLTRRRHRRPLSPLAVVMCRRRVVSRWRGQVSVWASTLGPCRPVAWAWAWGRQVGAPSSAPGHFPVAPASHLPHPCWWAAAVAAAQRGPPCRRRPSSLPLCLAMLTATRLSWMRLRTVVAMGGCWRAMHSHMQRQPRRRHSPLAHTPLP